MKNYHSKLLIILIIIVIISIAGWVIGLQTFLRKQNKANNITSMVSDKQGSEDLLYYLRDGDKITIYKASLNDGASTLIYTFQPKGPYSAFEGIYRNNFIFDENISEGDEKIKTPKYQRILISQDGKEVKDSSMPEFGDGSFLINGIWPTVESDNKVFTAFTQGSWENLKIIIAGENNWKEIALKDFPREASIMRPLLFSQDNSFLLIFGSLINNDVSNPESIYRYSLADGKITELLYNENGGFQHIDPKGSNAYFIDQSSFPRKLNRVNLTMGATTEVTSSINGGSIYFSKNGSRFIDKDQNSLYFQLYDSTSGKTIRNLPIYGDFLAWSSNGEYIIYQQEHDQTTESFYTELRAYNISTNKDILIYAGKKLQDAGDEPKFSFLGFIATANNALMLIEKNGFSFSYPKNLEMQEAGSTEKNYANYQLTNPIVTLGDRSVIYVSIPLKNTSSAFTLADSVKHETDPSKIVKTTLNGHQGESITYRLDTNYPGDRPVHAYRSQEYYYTKFETSPLLLDYIKYDTDASLDNTWDAIKKSIKY